MHYQAGLLIADPKLSDQLHRIFVFALLAKGLLQSVALGISGSASLFWVGCCGNKAVRSVRPVRDIASALICLPERYVYRSKTMDQ